MYRVHLFAAIAGLAILAGCQGQDSATNTRVEQKSSIAATPPAPSPRVEAVQPAPTVPPVIITPAPETTTTSTEQTTQAVSAEPTPKPLVITNEALNDLNHSIQALVVQKQEDGAPPDLHALANDVRQKIDAVSNGMQDPRNQKSKDQQDQFGTNVEKLRTLVSQYEGGTTGIETRTAIVNALNDVEASTGK